ncbi:unannotated protein [freshwater metagenome]|uniref:Unannotated protein n=1 Tax=freshwater metagenome TaxID=449393 RepID=A0A6J6PZ88_9ZZZZ
MERAARAASEAGSVVKDAGAIDHASGNGAVGLSCGPSACGCLGMELPLVGGEAGRTLDHGLHIGVVDEVGPKAAASLL